MPDLSVETLLKCTLRLHFPFVLFPPRNVVLKTDFMPHVQVAEKTLTLPRPCAVKHCGLSSAPSCRLQLTVLTSTLDRTE